MQSIKSTKLVGKSYILRSFAASAYPRFRVTIPTLANSEKPPTATEPDSGGTYENSTKLSWSELKHPRTTYNFFFAEIYPQEKKEATDLGFGGFSSIISQQWKRLNETKKK